MVANKHWHWWDIFHTGGSLDVARTIRFDRLFFHKHVQFRTSLFRSCPQPKPFPIRLSTHMQVSRNFGAARPQRVFFYLEQI